MKFKIKFIYCICTFAILFLIHIILWSFNPENNIIYGARIFSLDNLSIDNEVSFDYTPTFSGEFAMTLDVSCKQDQNCIGMLKDYMGTFSSKRENRNLPLKWKIKNKEKLLIEGVYDNSSGLGGNSHRTTLTLDKFHLDKKDYRIIFSTKKEHNLDAKFNHVVTITMYETDMKITPYLAAITLILTALRIIFIELYVIYVLWVLFAFKCYKILSKALTKTERSL